MTPLQMSISREMRRLLIEMDRDLPKLKITQKKPWWLKIGLSTLEKMTKTNYNDYTQTIGQTIYLAKNWDTFPEMSRLLILKHEAQHAKDFRKLSTPLMAILYLFVLFPVGLALARALIERRARAETLKLRLRLPGVDQESIKREERQAYLDVFCGPSYFWAWPFKKQVLKWFKKDFNSAVKNIKSV